MLAKNFENLRIGIPEHVGPIEIYALNSTKVSSGHQGPNATPSMGQVNFLESYEWVALLACR